MSLLAARSREETLCLALAARARGKALVPLDEVRYTIHGDGRTTTTRTPAGFVEEEDPVVARLDELLDIARRQERERLLLEHARLTAAFDRRHR